MHTFKKALKYLLNKLSKYTHWKKELQGHTPTINSSK